MNQLTFVSHLNIFTRNTDVEILSLSVCLSHKDGQVGQTDGQTELLRNVMPPYGDGRPCNKID